MVQFSKFAVGKPFKICLEFFQFFTAHIYSSNEKYTASGAYESILSELRQIVISRIMNPLQVLISFDAEGKLTDD